MRLIDADTVVNWEAFDSGDDTVKEESGTIADLIDSMTFEGCPEEVDAVPVRYGQWEVADTEYFQDVYVDTLRCSKCMKRVSHKINIHQYYITVEYNYCPNCGARMDGEDEVN